LSTPTFCQQYAGKIAPHQFSSLRYILVGAEKLRDSVARQFRDHFGIELLAGYGCTELGPGVAVSTPAESRPGSVGRPLDGIEIRIADPDTLETLPRGQQGMILVNGPSRMPGYYGAPELTRQAIRNGFYVTGDLGYLDEDGFLYVADRLARFSKLAGEMVPHLPIEEALSDLTPSFVAGVPDERRGERLVLLYTNPETTAAEIHERLSQCGLPPLWIPKRENIYPVTGIPVLSSGKLDLPRSRQLAASLATRAK
jgi:acyl-[acyl-carrier-protein]-phospholipid O-acyltransferase/long-chain-fatty-acid--[acyl-carrier-protein] ligase